MSIAGEDQRERDYRECREKVLFALDRKFPGLPDHEEIYQEAWAEALERERRGGDLTNPTKLLTTIALRRARDRLRNRRGEKTLEPRFFTYRPDTETSPADKVAVRIDADRIWRIVDTLSPRQAAIIKLRFGEQLGTKEIRERLGVQQKRLENLTTEAYKLVEEALTADADGETPWLRRQRSILLACEMEIATEAQRETARAMLAQDPVCRALLKELRATLHQVAGVLPMPVVAIAADGRMWTFRADLSDRLAAIRDSLGRLAERLSSHTPSVEQAGGGIAGLTTGAAAKALLVCIAVGGSTVVCIDSGLFAPSKPKHVPVKKHPPRRHQQHHGQVAAKSSSRPPAVVLPAVKPNPRPQPKVPRKHRKTTSPTPSQTTNVAAPPPPSPAPAGSTEFGPGNVGSQPASRTPAAAPANGGGEFTP